MQVNQNNKVIQRILNNGSKKKKSNVDNLIRLHHDFMKEYGWIHPDEFYSLPMDFINNMRDEINEDRKEENKQMKKLNKKKPKR